MKALYNPGRYSNKLMLAPMVRMGGLPFRLLNLRHGADLVYSEEIIDLKLSNCQRIENKYLNTIDYVSLKDFSVVFRTCQEEKEKLVLQIGTANGNNAIAAVKPMEDDLGSVDVNMGCPKHFSTAGGMGSELLKDPEKVETILTALANTITIPLTCKIRLLEPEEKTLAFVKMCQSTGISAIGVHMRYVRDKPNDPAHWEKLKAVVDSLEIPVIANGDIYTPEDITKIKELSGCSSAMLARGAVHNPQLYEGLDSDDINMEEIAREFLRLCLETGNHFGNTKYVMLYLIKKDKYMLKHYFNRIQRVKSYQEMCEIFGCQQELADYLAPNPEVMSLFLDGTYYKKNADSYGLKTPVQSTNKNDNESPKLAGKKRVTEEEETKVEEVVDGETKRFKADISATS
eukprot:CAMPEP_0115035900 /NCGR_PEP_ID=MMETSP0216-20121206/41772_1 /TAXON_ID=223996 /ORGANISM="Protocruzia adherens, Strain Boccale" /LENGTH=400 /DNA_ID=CAMNT_0002415565 /DNA_START=153 /DNA_END=1355 /DNA_ORIENTATION=-